MGISLISQFQQNLSLQNENVEKALKQKAWESDFNYLAYSSKTDCIGLGNRPFPNESPSFPMPNGDALTPSVEWGTRDNEHTDVYTEKGKEE